MQRICTTKSNKLLHLKPVHMISCWKSKQKYIFMQRELILLFYAVFDSEVIVVICHVCFSVVVFES